MVHPYSLSRASPGAEPRPCPRRLRRLWPVSIVCLALIGISAGSELSLTELRRKVRQAPSLLFPPGSPRRRHGHRRPQSLAADLLTRPSPPPQDFASLVLRLTAAISVCTWVFVFPVFLLIAPRVGFLAGAPRGRVLGVATLAATLGIARSPASMIAVLREMDGRGPFCSLVMSVTVVKDVLVLLLFAINVEIVASAEAKVRAAREALRGGLAGPAPGHSARMQCVMFDEIAADRTRPPRAGRRVQLRPAVAADDAPPAVQARSPARTRALSVRGRAVSDFVICAHPRTPAASRFLSYGAAWAA